MSNQPSPNVFRRNDGSIVLRVRGGSQVGSVDYVMDVSEALGLAIDLTNKVRVTIEMTAERKP